MSLPRDTLVLVADGRKMLFLRNKGDAGRMDLHIEAHGEQSLHKDSDMKSDLAGQSAAPGGTGRGAGTMGEVDYHQQAEDRWARDTAQLVNERALAHAFSALAVIAPPKTLGKLRLCGSGLQGTRSGAQTVLPWRALLLSTSEDDRNELK